jgi:hypothetical protein
LKRGGLLGKQTPRVSSIPEAFDFSAAEDALDLADIAGRSSLEWQTFSVRNGMAKRLDGKWAAYEVGLLVSRQNGKNGCIEVVELGWMVTEPGVSILHTAHEFQTAMESMDKLEALIRSHPMLEDEIAQVRHGNGKECIRLKNGSIIRFRTRTKSGGRGFSVDRLVIDEAMIWSPASQAAIMPLLTTATNPQIWYLGSAADAETHEYCGKWASLRSRATSGATAALCWMEWSSPEPPKEQVARQAWREDPTNWAEANPSLGYLLTEDFILDEMEAFADNLELWEVERLSTGRWPGENSKLPAAIKPEEWSAMISTAHQLTGPIALALDRTPDRQMWALAAAQHTTKGRIHLEIGYFQGATNAEVVEFILTVLDRSDPVALAIDSRSPAAVIAPLLLTAGVEAELTNTPQMAHACGGFLDDATNGVLSHTDQKILSDAATTAAKRFLPQGDFAWDKTGTAIAPLIAATLARWALLTFGAIGAKPTALPETTDRDHVSHSTDELDLMSTAF